jgi:hypothetical protein
MDTDVHAKALVHIGIDGILRVFSLQVDTYLFLSAYHIIAVYTSVCCDCNVLVCHCTYPLCIARLSDCCLSHSVLQAVMSIDCVQFVS